MRLACSLALALAACSSNAGPGDAGAGVDAPADLAAPADGEGPDAADTADAAADAAADGAADGALPADGGAPAPRPNIVVVMADDLDRALIMRMIAEGLAPNIRTHIRASGVTFTNAFASNPLCSPSRAAFLTGRLSHNHRVLSNSTTEGGVGRLDDGSTIATWMRAGGYRTGFVGKYINGYAGGAAGSPAYAPDYVPPGWDDWQGLARGTYNFRDFTIVDNGTPRRFNDPGDYQTDVLARRAVHFVNESERQDNRPFFLVVTPVAPHIELPNPFTGLAYGGLRPPPRYVGTVDLPLPMPESFNEGDVRDKPSWLSGRAPLSAERIADLRTLYRQRAESMRAVDDLVGDIVAALRANGELANTVLVFTSDNGYLLGQHRAAAKRQPYEESIRVPLMISGPGFAEGVDVDAMVVNQDMAPTLADLAGVAPGHVVDGRSFAPFLRRRTPARWRQRSLFQNWVESDEESVGQEIPDWRMVRTAADATPLPDYVFIRYPMLNEVELYNLGVDPLELTSRHNNPATMTAEDTMRGWLTDLAGCSGAACRTAEE